MGLCGSASSADDEVDGRERARGGLASLDLPGEASGGEEGEGVGWGLGRWVVGEGEDKGEGVGESGGEGRRPAGLARTRLGSCG